MHKSMAGLRVLFLLALVTVAAGGAAVCSSVRACSISDIFFSLLFVCLVFVYLL